MLRSRAGLLVAAFVLPALGLSAQSSALRISSTSGEPGEEVALDFRADLTLPLRTLYVNFNVSGASAEFLRVDVRETASAHVMPRGIAFNPRFFRGGYLAGVRFDMQGQRSFIEPGADVVLFRAVFRIHHDAAPGENAVTVSSVDASTPEATTIHFQFAGESSLRVHPPSRPRPAGSLSCAPFAQGVTLSWALAEEYDAIRLFREGSPLLDLPGSATTHTDAPPPGPRRYEVVAVRGGVSSLSSACQILVEEPRPEPITDLACSPLEDGVRITWTNGGAYDGVAIFRNGNRIADLAGSAGSHVDPYRSELFTIYTVKGSKDGLETLPLSCRMNELSDRFAMWADDVRADPGEGQVTVRFFVTNPVPLLGMQVALRIDPSLARIRQLTVDGTVSDASQYDYFAYQRTLEGGETAAGIAFDYVPPLGFPFPAGGDQHFLSLILDLLPSAGSGARIPVELGRPPDRLFGRPELYSLVIANGQEPPGLVIQDGSLLVGDSPVPEIDGARAEALEGEGGGAGAAGEAGAIGLSWRNGALYDSIRVERDGAFIAELPGDRESHLDLQPGPGAHRYRLIAVQGGTESFPAVTWARPRGIPGTFIRGDTDGDGRINLTDAVFVFRHLFQGGAQPECLDAADADDNGTLALPDPIAILIHLFLGQDPLPLPGPEPWFDPSEDGLTCG